MSAISDRRHSPTSALVRFAAYDDARDMTPARGAYAPHRLAAVLAVVAALLTTAGVSVASATSPHHRDHATVLATTAIAQPGHVASVGGSGAALSGDPGNASSLAAFLVTLAIWLVAFVLPHRRSIVRCTPRRGPPQFAVPL